MVGGLPLPPVTEPVEMALTLRAELEGGGVAEVRLATWRLVPTLEIQPVAPPAAALTSSSPLIAVCMATFDPPLELFQRQIESIRAQTHHNWVCVISDDNSRPERLAAIREVLGGDERFGLVLSEVRRGFYGNFERRLRWRPPRRGYLALSDGRPLAPRQARGPPRRARGPRVARLQRDAGGG